MVLAAGRGRRMRPLSDLVPKPALPLLGRPLVSWALAQARSAGASAVVVNVWHLAGLMEAAVRRAAGEGGVGISREKKLLGGAGGIAAARDRGLLGREGPVLVLNGDSVLDLDLAPLFARHAAARDLVTLALLPHPDPGRWSSVWLAPDGSVTAIVPPGGPPAAGTPYLYPGLMLLARAAVESIPAGAGEVGERIWSPAQKGGRLGGAVVRGRWREVGTPADYLAAVQALLGGESWVHPTARRAAGARVERSMLGEGVRVGEGAIVRDSVLALGVAVGRGCRVERSVMLGPVALPAGSSWADAVTAGPPGG